jgi:hypothetical protein
MRARGGRAVRAGSISSTASSVPIRRFPFVIITGPGGTSGAVASHYLTKPCDLHELLSRAKAC